MFHNDYYQVFYQQGEEAHVKIIRASNADDAMAQFYRDLPSAQIKNIYPL